MPRYSILPELTREDVFKQLFPKDPYDEPTPAAADVPPVRSGGRVPGGATPEARRITHQELLR